MLPSQIVPQAFGVAFWPLFSQPTATYVAAPANPANPGRFFGVAKLSGFYFSIFFIDFDAPRPPEMLEKPWENLGISMVCTNSANLLQSQQNAAMGCPGTLKMEAPSAQNGFLGRQNDAHKLQDKARERQDGLSECPYGCPDGPW